MKIKINKKQDFVIYEFVFLTLQHCTEKLQIIFIHSFYYEISEIFSRVYVFLMHMTMVKKV